MDVFENLDFVTATVNVETVFVADEGVVCTGLRDLVLELVIASVVWGGA